MSLVVLMSASGSPGVTTSALGLALTWDRQVMLVEADPTGGSAIAAGYLRGAVVPPESMIELALAQQDGAVLRRLPAVSAALPGTQVQWVAGTRSHEQARSLVPLWDPLAGAFRTLDSTSMDVIVDAGRLGLYGSPGPVIESADLALLVIRSDLVSLAGARSWAETLRDRFARNGASNSLGVLLVGAGDPFRAPEVARVLRLPVVSTVSFERDQAAVLSHGAQPPRAGLLHRLTGRSGWESSALMGSLRAARSSIRGTLRDNSAQLLRAGREQT